MGTKGEKTKRIICENAFQLFAEKGFKDVTMKDICEKTGLSRGGLYRHYENTGQIFLEIIRVLMADQQNEFEEKIRMAAAVSWMTRLWKTGLSSPPEPYGMREPVTTISCPQKKYSLTATPQIY